jgi:hypothetical protein
MKKWVKRQIGMLSLAMASVEKNALTQVGKDLDLNEREEQSHKKGTLEHALIQGEVTQEVRDLRWRMYKILEASDSLTTTIVGYDEDGMPITKTGTATSQRVLLNKVKIDEYDDYPLEIVQNNEPITMGTTEAGLNNNLSAYTDTQIIENKSKEKIDDDFGYDTDSVTLGEISNGDYTSFLKPEHPVVVTRELRPKFEIEKYTKKLHVRRIDDNQKLLEFYISKYPDEYDRKTRLLISEIKRAKENPRSTDILDINKINFITYKTLGTKDFHIYEYKVNQFDKIIEFDGFYVIKFKCVVTTNGEYLLEKYKEEELDKKYEKKQKKL